MLRGWRDRKAQVDERAAFDAVFEDITGHPSTKTIRGWSDEELHRRLTANDLHPVERSIADRELDKRKAWEAPAGKAYYIACGALAVAIVSLVLGLWNALPAP
jgi:hypothetical protein